MIRVTRLNGSAFIINADLIKFVEETPDTVVTLRDGEKLLVREPAAVVVARSVEHIRQTRFPPDLEAAPRRA